MQVFIIFYFPEIIRTQKFRSDRGDRGDRSDRGDRGERSDRGDRNDRNQPRTQSRNFNQRGPPQPRDDRDKPRRSLNQDELENRMPKFKADVKPVS